MGGDSILDNIKSMGRKFSKSTHSHSAQGNAAEEDEEDEELGSPIATMMYEFLTQPESGRYAYWWNAFTCALVVVRILQIGVESLNGPNQYSGRAINRARFTFLFTDLEYFQIYIGSFVPLIVDAFARVVMMVLLVFEQENAALLSRFTQDPSEIILFFADTMGVLPFFIYAGYLRPNDVRPSQAARIVMRILEMLTTGRIFRAVRRFPAIRAISVALGNSFGHLVLPIFFFFVFNITTGVFFYFAEPCYNIDLCPWINSFESTFFSIVTMTTTGYGNQVPAYELGRFVACCVMLFGSLYLSLPLAIIGNEYDKAWTAIQEEIASKDKPEVVEIVQNVESAEETKPAQQSVGKKNSFLITSQHAKVPGSTGSPLRKQSENLRKPSSAMSVLSDASASFANKKQLVQNYSPMILAEQILRKLSFLLPSLADSQSLSTAVVQSLCELRALLPTFQLSVEEMLRTLYYIANKEGDRTSNAFKGGRRFSIVGGGSGLAMPSSSEASSGAPPKPFPFNNPFSASLTTRKHSGGSGGIPVQFPFSLGSSLEYRRPSAHRRNTRDELPLIEGDAEAEAEGGSLSDFSLSSDEEESMAPFKAPHGSDREDRKHDADEYMGAQSKFKEDAAPARPSQIVIDHHDSSSSSESEEDEADNQIPQAELLFNAMSAHNAKFNETRREQPALTTNNGKPRNRQSLYNQMLVAIGVNDKHSKRRTLSENFLSRIKKVSENPDSLRSRIWILLELPHSSKEARALQLLIVFLVCLSIFVLYTQTMTSLTLYGETTTSCGKLLEAYCDDKEDILIDPGCFVQDSLGTTSQKLSFQCEESHCFGKGFNFGSDVTNMTCTNSLLPPFASKNELEFRYNSPYLFTSREHMHRINPVCTRLECVDNSGTYYNGNPMWIAVEFVTNLIFSIELVLRITVAESLYSYWQDKMNLFDILAIFPFYTELFKSIRSGGFQSVDFSILSSSPEPIFFVTMRALKVFRLFKLTRHFRASKVLTETARRVWRQILGMLGLLFFLVTLFSIIFFEMERGKQCFVGDSNCEVPESLREVVHAGDVLYINKYGEPSQFPNMFFGVWFSFVTLTTTGYGDIVPVTNGGQVMGIFLMLAGSFYMAMPLTAAASTFYTVHDQDRNNNADPAVAPEPQQENPNAPDNNAQKKKSTSLFDQRLVITLRYAMSELGKFEKTIGELVDEIFVSKEATQKSVASHTSLSSRIMTVLRSLEENMNNMDRDLVDLLSRHHTMLGHKS